MRKLLLLLCLVCACTPDPLAPHPVTDTDKCGDAESRLVALDCRDDRGRLLGGPNLKGVPFQERCRTAHNVGVWLNPLCLSNISNCKEIEACLKN